MQGISGDDGVAAHESIEGKAEGEALAEGPVCERRAFSQVTHLVDVARAAFVNDLREADNVGIGGSDDGGNVVKA